MTRPLMLTAPAETKATLRKTAILYAEMAFLFPHNSKPPAARRLGALSGGDS